LDWILHQIILLAYDIGTVSIYPNMKVRKLTVFLDTLSWHVRTELLTRLRSCVSS